MVRCCAFLVIIWAAGLQLTSTDIIDEAYSGDGSAEFTRDAQDLNGSGDEPYQQSDKRWLRRSRWRRYRNFRRLMWFIRRNNLWRICTKKAAKNTQHLLKEKERKHKTILRSNYQILQHGKGSLASNKEWLTAIKSGICAACVVKKICRRPPSFLPKYVSPCFLTTLMHGQVLESVFFLLSKCNALIGMVQGWRAKGG